MNILIIGKEGHFEEAKAKFGVTHSYTLISHQQEAAKHLSSHEVVFDFIIDQGRTQMEVYRDHPEMIAFLNTTVVSLRELAAQVNHSVNSSLFGFCGLPTFLNRPIVEVSVYKEEDAIKLKEVCAKLNTDYLKVDDRVGLVTPRVICMIINEAYYTVQEGTATREDIDLAMKLGTNYPWGPFEWIQKIGTGNVYDLLNAVYEDTKDERYKICALLKKEVH